VVFLQLPRRFRFVRDRDVVKAGKVLSRASADVRCAVITDDKVRIVTPLQRWTGIRIASRFGVKNNRCGAVAMSGYGLVPRADMHFVVQHPLSKAETIVDFFQRSDQTPVWRGKVGMPNDKQTIVGMKKRIQAVQAESQGERPIATPNAMINLPGPRLRSDICHQMQCETGNAWRCECHNQMQRNSTCSHSMLLFRSYLMMSI
jgi:hypothetical protein